MSIFNWSNAASILVIIYVAFSVNKFYEMINPLYGVEIPNGTPTVNPMWKPDQSFTMICYLTTSPRPIMDIETSTSTSKGLILWAKNNLKFNKLDHELQQTVIIASPSSKLPVNETTFITSSDIWMKLHKNQSSIYLHVTIKTDNSEDTSKVGILRGQVMLVKYDVIPKSFKHRYLLSDFGLVTPTADDGIKNFKSPLISPYFTSIYNLFIP
jgi:hypothetical protein